MRLWALFLLWMPILGWCQEEREDAQGEYLVMTRPYFLIQLLLSNHFYHLSKTKLDFKIILIFSLFRRKT